MGKLTSVLRKGCNMNYVIVEIFFFLSSNFLRKYGTEIFLFFVIMCISRVPNLF